MSMTSEYPAIFKAVEIAKFLLIYAGEIVYLD